MLSGGTTMFPGFSTRFKLEMDNCYRSHLKKGADDELKIKINVKVIKKKFCYIKKILGFTE